MAKKEQAANTDGTIKESKNSSRGDKELKKLTRGELLTMLIAATKRMDELELELKEANEKLADRSIQISQSGTLAEAALRVNGFFDAAEKAGAQYLESIKKLKDNEDETIRKTIEETQKKCKEIEEETKARCQEMVEKAKAEAMSYWSEAEVSK